MALNNTISISNLVKTLTLIGLIITGWVFITSSLVSAAKFHQHHLTSQANFIELHLYILEDRIDRASERGEAKRVEKLNQRRILLEHQQEAVTTEILLQ